MAKGEEVARGSAEQECEGDREHKLEYVCEYDGQDERAGVKVLQRAARNRTDQDQAERKKPKQRE